MAHPGSGPLQQRGGPRWAPTSPDPPSFVAAVHAAWLAHPPELGADHELSYPPPDSDVGTGVPRAGGFSRIICGTVTSL